MLQMGLYICFQAGDWNIHIYLQQRDMISHVYKTSAFA